MFYTISYIFYFEKRVIWLQISNDQSVNISSNSISFLIYLR